MTFHQQQHFVPRFLLKQWHTLPDNKLSSFKWINGRFVHGRYAAKSVGKMKNIYSTQRSSEQPNVSVECDVLGPLVDEPASLAHKVIVQKGVSALTKQEKIDWARFLVSLLHRVPAQMENIRIEGSKTLTQELEKEPDEYLDQRDEDTPEATLLELVNKRYPELLTDFGVMTLEALVNSPKLNAAFLEATWYTRRLEKPRPDILIGDNPLIYIGTFKTNFLVGLPVAPNIAFFALNNKKSLDDLSALDENLFVEKINQSSVRQADREVYATCAQHLSFVEMYLQK